MRNHANKKMRSVFIMGNSHQTKKSADIRLVLQTLFSHEVKIFLDEDFQTFIRDNNTADISQCQIVSKTENIHTDVAISMGGDGTFLKTAARIGTQPIPIVGINTGHLGFLSDITSENIRVAIASLAEGDYSIEQRSLIEVVADGEIIQESPFALNEVSILKHDNSSLIDVLCTVDEEALSNYTADGLIVCTPTGSTGYSLSAGGPIITPSSSSFCITAVAPHSLNVRPVIVTDDVQIRLNVKSRSHKFLISIDGRSQTLSENTVITLKKAPYSVGIIRIAGGSPWGTLRRKMQWGTDYRFG